MDTTLGVIFSASEISHDRVKGKVVVVIDVLRATSVMTTALNNGAHKIIPVLTPEEAFAIKKTAENKVVLAGERNADPIEGFDFGNSPLNMITENIQGVTLIMTTTNGTKAITNARMASELFVASFLNAVATVNAIEGFKDIVFIAAGTNGSFTLEDTLCSGYLASLLLERNENCFLSDAATAAYQLFLSVEDDLQCFAAGGKHYKLLKRKGFEKDLDYCFRKNELNVVCKRQGNAIVAL